MSRKMMNRYLDARITFVYRNQKAFAKELKVHQSYINRVVNGYETVSPQQKQRFADALKCTVQDIFPNGDTEPEKACSR